MNRQLRVALPRSLVQAMDRLIEQGEYMDRGDVVRTALRQLGGRA